MAIGLGPITGHSGSDPIIFDGGEAEHPVWSGATGIAGWRAETPDVALAAPAAGGGSPKELTGDWRGCWSVLCDGSGRIAAANEIHMRLVVALNKRP